MVLTLKKPINVFLDLDGVMVDLDSGLHRAIGRGYPTEILPDFEFKQYIHQMYADVVKSSGSLREFWGNLPAMTNYWELFDTIVANHGYPTILTATPKEYPVGCPEDVEAAQGKRDWVARRLSANVPVITTRSNRKQDFIVQGSTNILIDDYLANIKRWRDAGGIAIHHTSIDRSIAEFLKVLQDVSS